LFAKNLLISKKLFSFASSTSSNRLKENISVKSFKNNYVNHSPMRNPIQPSAWSAQHKLTTLNPKFATAPLHHCTIAPLHHCTIAPLHHCTIAPLLARDFYSP
jgi:hypothetical protein